LKKLECVKGGKKQQKFTFGFLAQKAVVKSSFPEFTEFTEFTQFHNFAHRPKLYLRRMAKRQRTDSPELGARILLQEAVVVSYRRGVADEYREVFWGDAWGRPQLILVPEIETC
jgi:hypothetical protein